MAPKKAKGKPGKAKERKTPRGDEPEREQQVRGNSRHTQYSGERRGAWPAVRACRLSSALVQAPRPQPNLALQLTNAERVERVKALWVLKTQEERVQLLTVSIEDVVKRAREEEPLTNPTPQGAVAGATCSSRELKLPRHGSCRSPTTRVLFLAAAPGRTA